LQSQFHDVADLQQSGLGWPLGVGWAGTYLQHLAYRDPTGTSGLYACDAPAHLRDWVT
jgi:hypothetical protein